MSYGKDDFLHWDDDIDLDSLLGDYACSEIELTDDDEPLTKKQKAKKLKSDNSENSAKAKTYNCSECTNSYASISGLRGHLRKKNNNMELQMQKVRRPFNILILYISLFDFFSLDFPKNDFLSGRCFPAMFSQCLTNM